jgi:hypothetical protein
MAKVQIVACIAAPNITTSTYSSWCPAASRRILVVDDVVIQGTTLEVQATAEPVDPDRVADMAALFGLFIGVLVIVWGSKQLLNLFSGDIEKG